MDGRSIVVTSGKGGVGKTTTVANIGTALARRGHKVVLVDSNFGLRNLDIILGLERQIFYDLSEVLEGECRVEEALIKDERAGELYLLAAPESRAVSETVSEQMKELCAQLRHEFDYVIVDAPNGLDEGFHSAVSCASEALVVTTPDVSSIRNVDAVIRALNKAGVLPLGLVLNRIRYNMMRRGEMLSVDEIPLLLETPLLGLVPERPEIVVASNRGTPSALNFRTSCGKAFRALAARIDGEEMPLDVRPRRELSRFGRLRAPEPAFTPPSSGSRSPISSSKAIVKELSVSTDIR